MFVPQRTVHHADAREWLASHGPLVGCSVITSMPDVSELPHLSLLEWKHWFIESASLIFAKCPDDGVAIFYQTDVKPRGFWLDKSYLCMKAAEQSGVELLWHKIALRKTLHAGPTGRAAFAHMLCFSRGVRLKNLMHAGVDILPVIGAVTWSRGMGIEACREACRFVIAGTETRTIVDPFCGHGTALAVANDMGLDAIGVELSRRRARRARGLRTTLDGASFMASDAHPNEGSST